MRRYYIWFSLLIMVPVLYSFVSNEARVSLKNNTAQIVPDTLSWRLLGRIKFYEKETDDYGPVWPIINKELKAINGNEIVMSGYIIPIDNEIYALSKSVFASCFFCGKAGPETIMGIDFKDKSLRLKTDAYVSLKGRFRANTTDDEDWIYHIEDAVIINRP